MEPGHEAVRWAAAAGLPFLLVAGLARPLLELLERSGCTRPAYDGRRLPGPGGLVWVLAACAGWAWVSGGTVPAAAAMGGALWGLLDDLAGGGLHGWRHHLGGLLRGRWSTGSAKMAGIALAGWAATGSLAGALAVAATANLINVLDVRPSRAAKAAWLLAWIPAALAPHREEAALLLPLLAGLVAWMPLDAGRQAMLGDAGANALGAALGALAWALLPPAAVAAWTAAALALQLWADRVSLTRAIARRRWLDWWDRLGVAEGQVSTGPP